MFQKSDSEDDGGDVDLEKSLREKALESLNRHKASVEDDDDDDD